MTPEKLKDILQKGEGIEVEFKTSRFDLNKDTFESICAFLNRRGGHLLLGIRNNGTVQGVIEDSVQSIANNVVTNANNPQKLNPPFYLSAQVIDYEGKKVIYVYVPESSQVHSTSGKIFDRNEDGDFEITRQTEQVTQLYLRKQTTYSENRIYPYLRLSDFEPELLRRVRALAKNDRADHPWQGMSDEELLRSAGLFKHDHQTGKDGYTLAAVLLLGRDEVIQSAFVRKHLPDRFYQEGAQRISLRDRIFREVIGNLLIHREFANAFPAKFIIEKDRVLIENWNRPHNGGAIDPANFSPYPKNPVIAKFFKEIGRVDELGSGVRNTFKYCRLYIPGTKPQFIEEDVFRTIIPLKAKVSEEAVSASGWDEVRKKVRMKFGGDMENEDDYGRNTEEIRKKYGRNTEEIRKKYGRSTEEIVAWMLLEPEITMEEIAQKIEKSQSTVEKTIRRLREAGILRRVGSTKAGHWKIEW